MRAPLPASLRSSLLHVGLATGLVLVGCGDDAATASGDGPTAGGSAGAAGSAGKGAGQAGSGVAGKAGSGAGGQAGGAAGKAGSSAGVGGVAGKAGNGGSSGASAGKGGADAGAGGEANAGAGGEANAGAGGEANAGAGGNADAGASGSAGQDGSAGEGGAAGSAAGSAGSAGSGGDQTGACAAIPCKHGGTCTAGDGGFRCACAPGYRGGTCEIDIDECAPEPCQNGGTCTDGVNQFTCACPQGFQGPACATNVADCPSPSPCQNGGTCVDRANGYTCSCDDKFGGDDCSVLCPDEEITAGQSGNWDDPATWLGGKVPGPSLRVLIPKDVKIVIPAGLSLRRFACGITDVFGELTNEGTLIADGSLLLKTSPGRSSKLNNAGTAELRGNVLGELNSGEINNLSGGKLQLFGRTQYWTLKNEGQLRLHGGAVLEWLSEKNAVFENTAGGTLTADAGSTMRITSIVGETAKNAGTLVSHGEIAWRNTMTNSGVLRSTGPLSITKVDGIACTLINAATGSLFTSGGLTLRCPLENAGTITNHGTWSSEGLVFIESKGTITNEAQGTFTNGYSFENTGTFVNHGTFGNLRSSDPNAQPGFVNSGTWLHTGTAYSRFTWKMQAGGTWTTEAGSTTELQVAGSNAGILEHRGSLIFSGPSGALYNNGTFNRYCGAAIVDGWGGGKVETHAPVDKCP